MSSTVGRALGEPGALWRRARSRDPVFYNDLFQLLKTVVGAVGAWLLARQVLDLPQSFLAPWSALLVVHATVYRTFARGARQVVGAVVGVVLAWGAGTLLGVDSTSVALVLAAGLALGALPWFAEETTVAAATGLIVLTTGFSAESMLVSRLADTAVGVGVGLLVNLVVWPPLRRRTAISKMDAIDDDIGALLLDMAEAVEQGRAAEEVEGWVQRTRDLDGDLDSAWALVRQARESARMNPRRSARGLRDPQEWHRLLRSMEQAVAECRSLAGTVVLDVEADARWDDGFRSSWVGLLRRAGQAITDADPTGLVEVRTGLDELAGEIGARSPAPSLWPVYGALMVNLRNTVETMGPVAEANPLEQPPLPIEVIAARRAAAARASE